MTAEEATTFQGYSVSNAARVQAALEARGCGCEPYEDVFTFGRWKAQGRVVCKGEKGIALPVIIVAGKDGGADETEDEESPGRPFRMSRTSHVFCRCQTTELAR